MKKIFLLPFVFICVSTYSQTTDTTKEPDWKKIYRATPTKINDLIHTRLDVKFDYNKSWMYGKEWVTIHPHFYQTDSLNLTWTSQNQKGLKTKS